MRGYIKLERGRTGKDPSEPPEELDPGGHACEPREQFHRLVTDSDTGWAEDG